MDAMPICTRCDCIAGFCSISRRQTCCPQSLHQTLPHANDFSRLKYLHQQLILLYTRRWMDSSRRFFETLDPVLRWQSSKGPPKSFDTYSQGEKWHSHSHCMETLPAVTSISIITVPTMSSALPR